MPSYERWKYCGHRTSGPHTKRGYCLGTAEYECGCGGRHWDEHRNSMGGVLSGTARPVYMLEGAEDHPRFLCSKHEEKY